MYTIFSKKGYKIYYFFTKKAYLCRQIFFYDLEGKI